jgi:putative PIN family toxin of toxin-antitoxin system
MPTLILDTNVVLDWLVFNHPSLINFTNYVNANLLNVLTHDAALGELRRVLNYPILKLDSARQTEVYSLYKTLSREAAIPAEFSTENLLSPEQFPKCRDPDDQLFLALAFHAKADALVTRDRAVLGMRKKARKFGVTILGVEEMRIRFCSSAE